MLESLTALRSRLNTSQSESEEDNTVDSRSRRQRRRQRKKNNVAENCSIRNTEMNGGIKTGDKDIAAKNLEENYQSKPKEKVFEVDQAKAKSLDVEAIKSETAEVVRVEANKVNANSLKTDVIEAGIIKSDITEMASIGAVNVEMTSVDAGAVRTQSLEVGTLMAMALEVGTLKARTLETDSNPGPVKVAMVRYDEYYKIIDVYSTDELTLLDPMFPHQPVRSEYIGNCNRLYYKFADLPCINPQTTYKFGVPYLLHFFKQLMNKGYRFSSVVVAAELNYTRDYVLIRTSSSNSRP